MPAIQMALLALLLFGDPPTPIDCAEAELGFQRLLASSFEVERTFRMSVNGDLKKREVARLTYSEGVLTSDVLEDEVLSKGLVLDADGKDFTLEIGFSCDRLALTDRGAYELTSEDGLEVATFELEPARNALRPISWRLDTTERFLFKKFVVEGRAEYSDLRWITGPRSEAPPES